MVGHPEKANQSHGVDVLKWYHIAVRVRQLKKWEMAGHAPKSFHILIFALAILAMPVAAVAKPSPHEQAPKAASQDENSRDKKSNPQVTAPSETKDVPFQPPTTKVSNESTDKDTLKVDWWARITNALVALGTIGLGVIGAVAARAAIRTLKVIERQTKSIHHQAVQVRKQTYILNESAKAAQKSAEAALLNAQAVINSERALLVAELIPMAVQFENIGWHRIESYGAVAMDQVEITAGHHLRHKLKLTNMGRTPAHILRYSISYSCLDVGVTSLSGKVVARHDSARIFDRLLSAGSSTEVPEVIDIQGYMQEHIQGIRQLRNTAVFHGWVEYQHVFSKTETVRSDFEYVYLPSSENLAVSHPSKPQDQHTKEPN